MLSFSYDNDNICYRFINIVNMHNILNSLLYNMLKKSEILMSRLKIFYMIMITLSLLVATVLISCDFNRVDDGSSLETGTTGPEQSDDKNYPSKSLLSDPYFKNGFSVKGLGGTDGTGIKGYFPEGCNESGNRVYWNLAQWSARYSLVDPKVSEQKQIADGVYIIQSPTLKFVVDTNQGLLTFNCSASKCYDTPRTGSEGWLHLLVETNFIAEDNWNKVTELKNLFVSIDTKLTKFEDHMGEAFNPSVHAAQFLMYIVVQNKNPESPDFNKYIWFGIGMFDNRSERINGGAMLDIGTGSMMYGLSSDDTLIGDYHYFKDSRIQAGDDTPWVPYKVDVMEHVEAALKVTQYKGYLRDTKMEDLYFTGMNLGWEVPGTYDVEMLVRDFDVRAVKKAD